MILEIDGHGDQKIKVVGVYALNAPKKMLPFERLSERSLKTTPVYQDLASWEDTSENVPRFVPDRGAVFHRTHHKESEPMFNIRAATRGTR